MNSYKVFDQEMTKEKFAKDKVLQKEIKERQKEIFNKLDNIVISVLGCDFNTNSSTHFLTEDGYFYKEEHNSNSYDYNLQLIGYLNPINMEKIMSYLLEEEHILERKFISYEEMFDYNVSIRFKYECLYYEIPDDELCSNNNISKYRETCFSSRVIDKLHELAENNGDLKDYQLRKELNKERGQIDKFLDMYGEQNDEIPIFLKRSYEQD